MRRKHLSDGLLLELAADAAVCASEVELNSRVIKLVSCVEATVTAATAVAVAAAPHVAVAQCCWPLLMQYC